VWAFMHAHVGAHVFDHDDGVRPVLLKFLNTNLREFAAEELGVRASVWRVLVLCACVSVSACIPDLVEHGNDNGSGVPGAVLGNGDEILPRDAHLDKETHVCVCVCVSVCVCKRVSVRFYHVGARLRVRRWRPGSTGAAGPWVPGSRT
jgi:hypothetical protein